jgi:hypothetical protein
MLGENTGDGMEWVYSVNMIIALLLEAATALLCPYTFFI